MRTASLAQPVRRAFKHHSHRGADGPKPLQRRGIHDTGIQMGQQPGFRKDELGHALQIFQRTAGTRGSQSIASHGVTLFGSITQGEESFLAVGCPARACYREYLLSR